VPLAIAAAVCLPALFGERWTSDTGLYTAVSLKAAREGHWWTLQMSDGVYFNKPPLAFWLHAVVFEVFGTVPEEIKPWMIRLPEFLAVLACVALTVRLARAFCAPFTAMCAGVALAFTQPFVLLVDSFRLDYLHTSFVLASVALVATAWKRALHGRRGTVRFIVISGVPIGLALLTKPLWGLAVPVVLGVWLAIFGRSMGGVRWLLLPLSLLVALLVAVPWHASMVSLHGDVFVDTYFKHQTMERATGAEFGVEPWWWYARELWDNAWVLLVMLVMVVVRLVRKGPGALSRGGAGTWLAIGWIVIMLVALSVFPDKKRYYIYHVYPFMAWACMMWLCAVMPRGLRRFVDSGLVWVAATMLTVSVLYVPSAMTRLYDGPPAWNRVHAWIVDNGVRELYNGSVKYNEAARVYVRTGVWPKSATWNNAISIEAPVGAIVLYDMTNPFSGERPAESDEVLLSAGDLRVVRRK
jgi:4-amino-4-deoxy-L-arabinose transferase-like glycosyltransferase